MTTIRASHRTIEQSKPQPSHPNRIRIYDKANGDGARGEREQIHAGHHEYAAERAGPQPGETVRDVKGSTIFDVTIAFIPWFCLPRMHGITLTSLPPPSAAASSPALLVSAVLAGETLVTAYYHLPGGHVRLPHPNPQASEKRREEIG